MCPNVSTAFEVQPISVTFPCWIKDGLVFLSFQTEQLCGDQRSLCGCVGVPVWAWDQHSGRWVVIVGSLLFTGVLMKTCRNMQSVTQMQVLHTTHNHVVTHIQWHEKVCLCVKHKLIRLIIEAKKLYFNHPLWSSLDQDGLGVCYWTCKDDTKNSRHG